MYHPNPSATSTQEGGGGQHRALAILPSRKTRYPFYEIMLGWFPTFQVATTCFSCSPPDLNLVVTDFMFCLHVK